MPIDDIKERSQDDADINCQVCLGLKVEERRLVCSKRANSDEICTCKGFSSISHKSVHYSSEKYRDMLIEISLFCKETDITSFVNSLDDMSRLFQNFNLTVNKFFGQCFTESKFKGRINLDWQSTSSNESFKVLRYNSSIIDTEGLNKYMAIDKGGHICQKLKKWLMRKLFTPLKKKQLVEVKLLRTNWIFRQDKNEQGKSANQFLELIDVLDD